MKKDIYQKEHLEINEGNSIGNEFWLIAKPALIHLGILWLENKFCLFLALCLKYLILLEVAINEYTYLTGIEHNTFRVELDAHKSKS